LGLFHPTCGLVLIYFQTAQPPFILAPTYTFGWKGQRIPALIDENHCKTDIKQRYMKVILLSIADMFIKFTVKNKSPHLETLLFLNFYVKILKFSQAKMLPNPVLLQLLDSCFDQAGRNLEEKRKKIKSMSPSLIVEPLCKTGSKQRNTKLGEIVTYQLWRGNPVIISS